jgi:octaprenyl-diphosphate synthase
VSSGQSLARLLGPVMPELAQVEQLLAAQVESFDPGVKEYVHYVLGGTGKRLRPSLALLCGGATGAVGQAHIKLGVIVELIHVATLVHDDVLDDADIRHGLPTANSRWGNEISVLLGDSLFAHALQLAASYPTTDMCRRVSEATNTVCSGEIIQNQRRFDLKLTLEQYLGVIAMKTGALFAVSCELGAALNGVAPTVVKMLREYGDNLGIAYQVYDDCVDLFGQERTFGKSLGTDVKKGKLTLPYLLLLDATEQSRRAEISEMIFADRTEDRRQLCAWFNDAGVAAECLATIDGYITRARTNLTALTPGVYADALGDLLTYLERQSRLILNREAAA